MSRALKMSARVNLNNRLKKLRLKRLKRHPGPKSDRRSYKAGDSLLFAIRELMRVNSICESEIQSKRLTESKLFDAIVRVCQQCRMAFGIWNEEVIFEGPLAAHKDLPAAMMKSHSLVGQALPLLKVDSHIMLGRAYLEHIQERLDLYEIAANGGVRSYEAAAFAALEKAYQAAKR